MDGRQVGTELNGTVQNGTERNRRGCDGLRLGAGLCRVGPYGIERYQMGENSTGRGDRRGGGLEWLPHFCRIGK